MMYLYAASKMIAHNFMKVNNNYEFGETMHFDEAYLLPFDST